MHLIFLWRHFFVPELIKILFFLFLTSFYSYTGTVLCSFNQNLPALAVFLSTDQDAVEELFQRVDTPLGEDSDPHVKGKKVTMITF